MDEPPIPSPTTPRCRDGGSAVSRSDHGQERHRNGAELHPRLIHARTRQARSAPNTTSAAAPRVYPAWPAKRPAPVAAKAPSRSGPAQQTTAMIAITSWQATVETAPLIERSGRVVLGRISGLRRSPALHHTQSGPMRVQVASCSAIGAIASAARSMIPSRPVRASR